MKFVANYFDRFCRLVVAAINVTAVYVFVYSNNMLYPKEDKENRILLYAVSLHNTTLSV